MTTLTDLLEDRRFQSLMGKAETHQRKFRPEETKAMEKEGRLTQVLQERTHTCWLALKSARQGGMTMLEAQEIAFPIILLPDETEEDS